MRIFGAAVFGAAMAIACSAAQADDTWHHAIIAAKADAGVLYMVGQPGFADKQGLKLELTQVDSDAIGLKALIAGQVDSYEGSPTGAMIAAARGADVKILGCQWPGLPHGVFVRGNITKPEDLKGKTIAISQPGAMPDQLIRALLAKYGLKPDDVKFANLGSDNDRYKALVAGVVDAAVISGEYMPIAEKAGVHMLIRGREVLPDYLRVCIMSSSKVEKARHDDLVKFLAAEMTAMRYVVTHRDETIALTQKTAGSKPDDPRAAYMYDDAVKTHALDPDLGLPIAKLDWMQQQSVKNGDQPKLVDLKIVADDGPREEALKKISQ
ncbi:MAG TPA: ABC transporter substrate-binding protein [Stellaceae bacterium]|nr:ABC transporter substrate-binding protein [Stellaceae bacterium]